MQLRVVAPVPLKGMTLLPRLTLRYALNRNDEWGFQPTDLFALIVPGFTDWGTGRAGIGPDFVVPAQSGFGPTVWQFGLAGVVIQRFLNDKLLVGLLLQQVWGKTDPSNPDDVKAGPLVINPFAAYQLGKGLYLQTNDLQARYNWDTNALRMPIGLRFGYVIVKPKGSWNFYVEYATNLKTEDWIGPVAKHQYRLNVSYTMPI
jgi:hypothetical protein